MEISKNNSDIILKNVMDFNPKHTFDCGQCFRFVKTGDNEYTGVAGSKALTMAYDKNTITLFDTAEEDFNNFWTKYFDFDKDYDFIKKSISGDECMNNAISEGAGIRILNQDLFETIISFIISQSNNIPRIRKIIENLCTLCGEQIVYRNSTFYAFPKPEVLAEADISCIRAGYREKYILDTAKFISKNPQFLTDLKMANSGTAKSMLMSLNGIGNKVSDCILLFGLNKTDSFPVDVWMRRIMEQLYFKKKCSISEIADYASNKFGEFSGYAQQYLFYYALNHKSELKEEL